MYQVWTKADEYTGWTRKDCGSISEAGAEILAAMKRGAEPLLTVEVPFSVNVEFREDKIGETAKVETEPGESARAKGKGKIRPGDFSAVPELNP